MQSGMVPKNTLQVPTNGTHKYMSAAAAASLAWLCLSLKPLRGAGDEWGKR